MAHDSSPVTAASHFLRTFVYPASRQQRQIMVDVKREKLTKYTAATPRREHAMSTEVAKFVY